MNSNITGVPLGGWVSGPDFRGTQDIIWSCFLAVFVCTWTILHLNLPPEDEKEWQRKLRKVRWMTMAVIIPEVVTAAAFAQRVAARNARRSMEQIGHTWSLSQAFYLNMGGAWLQPLDSKAFPVNAAHIEHLIRHGNIESLSISREEIWDRSKADKFAKLFACAQIFWLATQSIGRAIQGLAVTPLEIATLGFAVPSLATFAFWFSKPVDIEVPNYIKINCTTQQLLEKLSPKVYNWRETPLDFVQKVNTPSVTSELILKNRFWPGRDRFRGPANRIRNDVFAMKYSKLDQLLVVTVWIAYGGTHFSAWTFEFPTYIELMWWRISCIVMSASMFVFWITSNRKFYLLVPYLAPWVKDKEKWKKVAYEQQRVSDVQIATGAFTALAYLVARLSLIALSLASLRSLPATAFRTVNWAKFLPHAS